MDLPLRVAVAVSIAVGGALHLDLARAAYRGAPIEKPFYLNVVLSAFAFAVVLIPKRIAALPALAVGVGSLIAFALSRGPGLPVLDGTWQETGLNPDRMLLGVNTTIVILVVEAVAALGCLALLVRRRSNDRVGS